MPLRTLCFLLLSALFLAPATGWAAGPAETAADEFPPAKVMQKLAPHNLVRTLMAYERTRALRARNPRVKIPVLTLLLEGGHQLTGVVARTDFDQNRLSLLLSEKRFVANVAFVEFRQVRTFIVHDVDLYPEFLDELAKES